MTQTILTGQTLSFTGSPFREGPDAAVLHHRRGAVLVEGGRIADVGDAERIRGIAPTARVIDHGERLLMAGFVDAHVHYPQTGIIASWGKRLIDWLNSYTFPEEMRFGDPDYAAEMAGVYLDLSLVNGITTACSFCTIHPESVDAYFTAAQARGMRMAGGKVMMDRNAPDGLRDTAQSGYDQSKALLDRWHGVDRLTYAVTPRFAPTSTPEQLEAAGALWAAHPDCLMQTHLSEQTEEIAWVGDLYPDAPDYLGVYERYGLTGRGALMGHSIHLTDREWAALSDSGTSVVHCPTSNTFIGSGLFNAREAARRGIPTGLATDVGGGSSFSMLRTMAAAYEVGQLGGSALHPAELLWLATCGSAHAMRMGDRIGNLAAGMEADIIALDLASTPVIAQRAARAGTLWEAIFPTIMMGDDRAVTVAMIGGKPV
ncbi:guanine deaminase [Oceanomicrobium pacificus]|uniref:Guanine deaminase n=1 Tax=Oceanomicrobium pacificus TaxID=2692916 RepID=A0A6B0TXV0_9RHOB|nr:guanine deaminase [Oceanomicrobium pacificus]MXU66122.1 guanine deaminase [Oceanomicrobium pacificus]